MFWVHELSCTDFDSHLTPFWSISSAPEPPKSLQTYRKNKDFGILHFSTSHPRNCLSGLVWGPQNFKNRLRDAAWAAQVTPRWRPNRSLDLQNARPDEPWALQTAIQTVQEPILEVPGGWDGLWGWIFFILFYFILLLFYFIYSISFLFLFNFFFLFCYLNLKLFYFFFDILS